MEKVEVLQRRRSWKPECLAKYETTYMMTILTMMCVSPMMPVMRMMIIIIIMIVYNYDNASEI